MTDITCAGEASDAAAEAKLDIGDPVPAYTPEWLQGGPVTWLEPGKLYLVECWATWCGPCRATIPHVDALHRKYSARGLVVIGQNVWEDDRDAVTSFLEEQGDAMSYPVAANDDAFARDWLKPAGVQGIPHAFLVRDGRLVWKCHPGELDDATVERLLDGSFDAAAAARAAGRKRALREQAQDQMEAGDWTAARRTLDDIVREQGDDGTEFAQSFRLAVLLGTGQFDTAADEMRQEIARDTDEVIGTAWTVANFRVGLQSPVIMALALEAADKGLTKNHSPGMLALAAELKALAGRQQEAIPLVRQGLDAATRDGKAPAYLQKLLAALLAGSVPARADLNAWAREGYVERAG
jgi:thiol-disulfide isomerase/thioredoxin